ncbi:VOC family protein [Acinetobacter ursingii]|uniref:VOC family protein n=1 Tax=Acinetobacter ursingii TaxID=108980 RepID=UPI000CF2069C|nr:VOC family protein [Acinetobacter ursingii]MCU4490372.1 VOC family protein [Acinetobacter ursingii]MDA3578061.1 VOC family protein [Acinetobacter ursingii]MDG9861709.1 VOC family protein [Acinetobacter ursingii]MDG9893499.1 VOC family protein [Acinetobacter ursingii]MDH0007167.1 VOC family protein [Acinetobacter ursingii]
MRISHLDHLVLTVAEIEATCNFYQHVLNFEVIEFGENRKALKFGSQKINLHQTGHEFEPKAAFPTQGSADLCFISETPIEHIIQQLKQLHIDIEQGPIQRTGVMGAILSVYIRDPDHNLIEISNYL